MVQLFFTINFLKGPDTWGQKYPACNSNMQSPVDITEVDALINEKLPPLKINWQSSIGQAHFEGATCQTTLQNSNLFIEGGPLPRNESFQLVHFHTHEVSEHHINGIAYPVELHFVHESESGLFHFQKVTKRKNCCCCLFFQSD